MAAPKTILFVGDIHCGSKVGLWPMQWISAGPGELVGARYLMECWEHFIHSKAVPRTIDLLVLMGDLIDGPQRKSESTGVFTASYGEQVDGAVRVLRPLTRRARKIIRVDGTPYHEGFHSAVSKLDTALGVDLASQVLDIELPGGVMNIAHHPSGGGALYKGTTADRETLWSIIAAHGKKVPEARWVVRAHQHHFAHWQTESREMLCTPCWQLQTAHAKKGNYFRWQPSLGAVLMLADASLPGGYQTRPILYDPPLPTVHKLEV